MLIVENASKLLHNFLSSRKNVDGKIDAFEEIKSFKVWNDHELYKNQFEYFASERWNDFDRCLAVNHNSCIETIDVMRGKYWFNITR